LHRKFLPSEKSYFNFALGNTKLTLIILDNKNFRPFNAEHSHFTLLVFSVFKPVYYQEIGNNVMHSTAAQQ